MHWGVIHYLSCNYAISDLLPLLSTSLLIPFQVRLIRFIKTSLFYPRAWNAKFRVLETMPVKTPAKWINNPDGLVSRFVLPLFPAGLMWRIVIRFVFLVCRQKYALREENLWPFIFSPIPLFSRFSRPPISSYFLSCFRLAYDSSWEVVFFKNKLSGKNGAIAELNFWHTKYQSGFRAIWPFSCGFCLKLFPFNSFAELSLVRPIKPRKGNLSWLKPKRKDNFYWSVMFIAG